MDRRSFFKVLMTTSLLSPMILRNKQPEALRGLYLISDRPQDHLPLLLEELRRQGAWDVSRYSVDASHPHEREVSAALASRGFINSTKPKAPVLRLSYSALEQKALPSFTLLHANRICDIRSARLSARWDSMRAVEGPSSILTVASSFFPSQARYARNSLRVHLDGKRIDSLDLGSDSFREFNASKGRISVRVEGGQARIVNAPCRHKVCSLSPPISRPGERILCAPCRFYIEISGDSPVDTVIG